jgi:hypothetical protein
MLELKLQLLICQIQKKNSDRRGFGYPLNLLLFANWESDAIDSYMGKIIKQHDNPLNIRLMGGHKNAI